MPHNYTLQYAPQSHLSPLALELLASWHRPAIRARKLQAKGMNDQRFQGILTRLGVPSTKPPQGSEGRRTIIPHALARQTLGQLRGLPVNMTADLKDHEKKTIVGHIQEAWIDGDKLMVCGTLYDKNVPDLVNRIRATVGQLGMSYEVSDCTIEDTNAPEWTLSGLQWVGAAILQKAAAAYQDTSLALAA